MSLERLSYLGTVIIAAVAVVGVPIALIQ